MLMLTARDAVPDVVGGLDLSERVWAGPAKRTRTTAAAAIAISIATTASNAETTRSKWPLSGVPT